jgi:hypothetical protein
MGQPDNIQDIRTLIKRGFLDNAERQLVISPEYLELEENNLRSAPLTRFNKSEIAECRFGVKWHSGIYFMIGREFQIFIRNREKQVLKINFNSYLGIGKKRSGDLYVEIVEKLLRFYFHDIMNDSLNKFLVGEDFQIGEVKISKQGVTIKINSFVAEQENFIPWNKIGTRDYQTYFAIFSIEDSANINKGFSYLNDWNTIVLAKVVQAILDNKKVLRN